jgi:hypothetical protein
MHLNATKTNVMLTPLVFTLVFWVLDSNFMEI